MSPSSSPPKPVVEQDVKSPGEIDIQHQSLQIRGNVPLDINRRLLLLLQFFVGTPDLSYGAKIGQRLKLVEANVWDSPFPYHPGEIGSRKEGLKVAQTVFEITVEQDMVNSFGMLHGGCATYLIDPCSASSLLAMGVVKGKIAEFAGLSQSMNILWHHPIKLGTKIRLMSTSMAVSGKIKTARCEIWNGDILCVSAIHSMANPGKGPVFKDNLSRVVKL